MGYDVFTKRCGCGAIHPVRSTCPACIDRKRAEAVAKARQERSARNRQLASALRGLFDDCLIRIYAGTRPKNADEPLRENTLLIETRVGEFWYPIATGRASFARVVSAKDGITLCDLSVSRFGGVGEVMLPSLDVVAGKRGYPLDLNVSLLEPTPPAEPFEPRCAPTFEEIQQWHDEIMRQR